MFILVVHDHHLICAFVRSLHFLHLAVLALQYLLLLFLQVAAVEHVFGQGVVWVVEMVQRYFLFGGDDLLGQGVLLSYVLRKRLALEFLSV